jgi:GNAT superfamily N-acetyltransferase
VTWGIVKRENFHLVRGTLRHVEHAGRVRAFAACCGTQILFEDAPNWPRVDVAIATLVEPRPFRPRRAIWTEDKLPWVILDPEVPASLTQPDSQAPQSAHSKLMRKASLADIQLLVRMMAEFYSDSPYTLNSRRATEAFNALLSDERLGSVWIIQSNAQDVGYVVLTLCHAMTYGGLVAVVDDFFIQPAFRGRGLGKAAIAEVRSYCAARRIRAIHVETGRDNEVALAVYRGAGFVVKDHVQLELQLADPTHAP